MGYFCELEYIIDFIYCAIGVTNTITQNLYDSQTIQCKILMTILFLMQIVKTFSFLRIYESIAYIVTMIQSVFYDLRIFLLFYAIMIFLFS